MEQFNHILKKTLCKLAKEDGKDWYTLLPYLLIAHHEVPQDSTGFLPFELLYRWTVHGPFDIVEEWWEVNPDHTESIVSYALLMRERP